MSWSSMRKQAELKRGVFVDLARAEDVRALLLDPDRQWKDGRSAAELTSWWNGVPAVVAMMVASDRSLARKQCERVVFEKKTSVPGAGGATRTDLMAYFDESAVPLVIAVEGKAGETFDAMCSAWVDGGSSPRSPANRRKRLAALCKIVGCSSDAAMGLRYQLLVRTAAALHEAKAVGASRAIMLVHSFDPAAYGANDFFRFAASIGVELEAFNRLSPPMERGAVTLQLGWARDVARAQPPAADATIERDDTRRRR
jgi:hypothetical protein